MPDFHDTSFPLQEIAQRLKLNRSGRHWRGACPVCGRDAFSLTANGEKPLVHCFAGCEPKDLLAVVRPRAPVERARRVRARSCADPAPPDQPRDWSAEAEALWNRGVAFDGTLLETYLAHRGCLIPDAQDIRFLPAGSYGADPAMLARVTDAVTAQPISLHFTRLAADGRGKAACDRPKRLLGGHRKAGGVVRLVEDAEVTAGLGLAEGIETALAVMAGGWSPVWATLDAGNMAAFPVLDGIESLSLFADNDARGTGLQAAETCAKRWRADGREAGIVMPTETDTDWNDIGREGQAA